jgi:autonomous glycyl radical cofactor GrcA
LANEGTKVDSLYLELGIDTDSFDADFAAANKKVTEAAKKITRDQKLNKIKMDIELSGIDDADKSTVGLTARLDHLNKIMQTQKTLIEVVNQGYMETARLKGADAGLSKLLEERLLREQKKMADLAQQARETNKQLSATLNQPAGTGSAGITKQVAQEAATAESSLAVLGNTVKNTLASLAVMLAARVSINWFANVNSETEKMQMQLKVLLKDINETRRAMAEMKKFADITPFNTGEVVEAGKMLIAADIKDYKEYLTLAGDWAAATGKNITEIASVFSRVQSGQYGEAIERMRELNISTLDLLAEGLQFSKSNEFLGTADQLMAALQSIIKKRFGGMTDELSQSWEGAWSTFVSGLEESGRLLSSSSFEGFRDTLIRINEELDKINKSGKLEASGRKIRGTGETLADVLKVLAGDLPAENIADSFSAVKGLEYFAEYGTKAASALAQLNAEHQANMQYYHDMSNAVGDEAKAAVADRLAESMKRINQEYERRNALLRGEAPADVNKSWSDMLQEQDTKTAEDAAKNAQKRIINYQKEVTQERLLFDTKIEIAKAFREDSVSIAQQQLEFEQKNLAKLEELEQQAREAMGAKYKPSGAYLDAQKKVADTQMGYLDAQIQKASDLGQYMLEYEKILAEVQAIEKVGGNTTVKRYQAQKQAIKDYLASLEEYRQITDDIVFSNRRMEAAIGSLTISNVGGVVESGSQSIRVAGQTIKTNMEALTNSLELIDSKEKVIQAERLAERLSTIQNILKNEKLGVQQRKELMVQEANTFTQFRNTITQGIQDNLRSLESLQQKAMSTVGRSMGLLSKLQEQGYEVSDTTVRKLQAAMNQYWATSDKSAAAMMSLLDMGDKLAELSGQSVKLPFSYAQAERTAVNEAVKSMDAYATGAKTLKDNLQQLSNMGSGQDLMQTFAGDWQQYSQTLQTKMTEMWQTIDVSGVGQQAATTFFAPWNAAIDGLKEKISGIRIEPSANINASAGAQPAGVVKSFQISIPVAISNPVVRNDKDITDLADQVAAKIQKPLVRAIQGADDYAV